MQCRKQCGACCIAPSITTPFLGMPRGKPAGVKCIHLDYQQRCQLFGDIRRPNLCKIFNPEKEFCGESFLEAYKNLTSIEFYTSKDRIEVVNS